MKTYKEIMKEKNISPSYTRVRIYNYFEQENHHPTVDEIYSSLKPELPTLSKTTVYNVLKLFIEKGLVKAVNMSGTEIKYELYEDKHSHFRCIKCNKIYDIPYIKPNYKQEDIMNFTVIEEEVNLSGICKDCAEKIN
jgi:Fe2+ or Zn2+ uptake regulation protein